MRSEKVIVAGAGVAGLSTAILLAERGIESLVLESRQRFDGPTSGVRVSAAGVQILKSMQVDSIGEPTTRVGMRLGDISVSFLTPDTEGPAIIVTRLALHEKLMERAQSLGIQVVTGFRVASVAESAEGVEVTSESGERATGTLLVGADGVGSTIRQVLNPGQGSTKSYAGYLGAGFITEDEAKIEMTLHRYPGQQVGIASCGKVSSSALKQSTFLWTHLHMPEADARLATRASVEAELSRRSASWSPALKSKFDLYTKDAHAILAYGPVYNGEPPSNWHSDRMMLVGDAAHPYGPGGQGISMALKDAQALGELIARGFTEDGRREFQRSRAQESRTLGDAAEKRNAREDSSTRWGVLAEGVFMKAVEIFTRGKLRI